MMDLHHLESDELQMEYNIRKLDPKADSALVELSKIIIDEQSGSRQLPSLPPFSKTSSEITLCKRKMSQLETERVQLGDPVEESALAVLRSRALHLISRLERLSAYESENRAITKILEDARKLWDRLVPSRLGDDSSNTSAEPELAGFTASGVGFQPSSNNTGSAQSSPTGTIPKQTNNQRVNSQLPTWSIDPSIIVTGRASIPSSNANPQGSVFQSFVGQSNSGQSIGKSAGVSNNSFSANRLSGNQASAYQAQNLNLPPPPAVIDEPAVRAAAQARNRTGLTHTLSKWTVRFSGSVKDLAVDEFFFRVENLATADNVHADSLLLGFHCLLTGNASDFYWVQRRKNPNHTWAAFKRCMIAHFARQETDLEIRRVIMGRVQGLSEGFGDFSLAMECLAARLTRPMADDELMDILRQNMSPKLQTCMLMINTPNTETLKTVCLKYERLWASQAEALKDRRMTRRMAELGFEDTPQVEEVRGPNVRQLNFPSGFLGYGDEAEFNGGEVAAMARAKPVPNRNEYMVCWNCDDLGHSFTDCSSPDRKVFCYGCGTKNAYKPSCIKCNPGNLKPGGIVQGQSRSTPNPFSLLRPNQNQTPK